jgi:ADP-ribose pyrophosphatase YjhB (NUDIX family)
VESAEAPWGAVEREVLEEVGLQVRVERLLGVYSVPTKEDLVFMFTFLCVPVAGVPTESEKADRVAWFNRASIPANTLPRHVERIEDAYASRKGLCLKVQA